MTKTPAPRRKRGRPRREKELAAEELKGVCTKAEKAAAKKVADALGESLSQFVVTSVAERVRRLSA